MHRMRGVVVLAAGIALTGGACGNDHERLSTAEFTEQVKVACVRATEAGEHALPFDPPPDTRLTTARIDDFAASLEGFADDVRALRAPEDLEDEADEFAAAVDAYASEFREVADRGGSENELEAALGPLFGRFRELDEYVKPLGLSSILGCGGEIESHVPPEAPPDESS